MNKIPPELARLARQAARANTHCSNGDDVLGDTERNRTTEKLNQNVVYWAKVFDLINIKIKAIVDKLELKVEYNGIWPTFYDKQNRIIDY